MKISFSREAAAAGLHPLQGLIGSRSMVPVLSNILVTADSTGCCLVATDLEIWIASRFEAVVENPGSITLPGRRFLNICREAPVDPISLEGDETSSRISCGRSRFKMVGVPCSEFPAEPRLGETVDVRIPQAELKRLLRQSSFAMSQDQSRYILNGVYISFKSGAVTAVATDGKKLAVSEHPAQLPDELDREMVLPEKTVSELLRILGDSGDVEIRIGQKQAAFEAGNVLLVARLVDGRYPDYRQVIPSESTVKMMVPREEFMQVVRRGSLLSSEKSNSVRFDFSPGMLTVSSTTPEVGESRDEMNIDFQGDSLAIAFNPQFLLEILRAVDDKDEVVLELIDGGRPGIFRSEHFFCLIMPIKLL
ncbi:MAG TPA: DNA polymerase III subunit beta [bacterium]|nr:DNA polymerase III subunit beta [bacterium]HPJ71829.1 DNA polymerase III subunit beta [bacterium]HPQ65263.1 DNA polymerase III subunit beta [bacterium]